MPSPIDKYGIRPCKEIVANWLVGKEFDSVIELGCQWSENLLAIRKLFPNVKLVGIDTDIVTIGESKYYLKDIETEVGDARKTRFDDKSFDVVFINALLCMNQPEDNENIISEIIRLAKKYIILVELDRTGDGYDSLRGRTRGDYVALFKQCGLTVDKRKITMLEWSVEPWLTNGYLYTITL